jgi:hypothetical protein
VRRRGLIAIVAVGLLAVVVAGIAIAAGGGGDEEKATGTDLTAVVCPLEPAENAFDTEELIGMSLDDARAKAAEHTCEIVVAIEDGRGLPVPVDVDPKRIYVYTEDDVVTEIEGVGGGI